MTLSFCVGVGIIGGGGIGSPPASLMPPTTTQQDKVDLPKVTSVNMEMEKLKETADGGGDDGDEEVHEPAGQVRSSMFLRQANKRFSISY